MSAAITAGAASRGRRVSSGWSETDPAPLPDDPGPTTKPRLNTSYLMMSPPGVPSDSLRVDMPARNQWHDFSWTVHWQSDGSGHAKLLVDNVVIFDYHGRTIHAGESTYYPKFGSCLANNPYTQITFTTPWIVTKL